MPSLVGTNTLTNAGDRVNIMQGSPYEFLPWDALVEISLMAAAGDAPTAIITSGSDVLMLNGVLNEKAVTLPITTEDIQLRDVAAAGERLVVEVTATLAGDVVRHLIVITPI